MINIKNNEQIDIDKYLSTVDNLSRCPDSYESNKEKIIQIVTDGAENLKNSDIKMGEINEAFLDFLIERMNTFENNEKFIIH
jgi:hypothetical protein